MKTVSTLCATSTVGIAACGFALARPCKLNDAHDQLTNYNSNTFTTNNTNNNTTPIIREPVGGGSGGGNTPKSEKRKSYRKSWGGSGSYGGGGNHNNNNNGGETLFPTDEPSPRTSTSRRWLHRLSESFSSSSSSSSTPSSPTSSTSQSRSASSFSSRSRPYTSSSLVPFGARRSSSRPRTGNKLVKRNPSSRNAAKQVEEISGNDGTRMEEHDSSSPTTAKTTATATATPTTTPANWSPSHRQRPSTAGVHQSSTQGQSSPISPIHASRPSTSALFSPSSTSPKRNYHQQAVAQPPPTTSWRGFFTPKRHKLSSSKNIHTTSSTPSSSSSPGTSGGLKLHRKPFSGVRRIYPKQLQKSGGGGRGELVGPTLMLAPTRATTNQPPRYSSELLDIDIDSESVFSGADSSLFFDSRPASRMDDLVELAAVRRSSTGMALGMGLGATSPRNSARRRSLSGVNYLQTAPIHYRSLNTCGNGDGIEDCCDGLSALDFGFGRMESSPSTGAAAANATASTHATTTHTSNNAFHTHTHTTTTATNTTTNIHSLSSSSHYYHYYHTRSVSQEEDIPPVPSLPQLDGNMDVVSRAHSSSPDHQQQGGENSDYCQESSLSPDDSHNGDADADADETDPDFDLDLDEGRNIVSLSISDRPHRLSLVSTSERASTLIGSEDLNNMEDFQSDTVFDSMRTRASELTPRADTLFDPQQDESSFGNSGNGPENHRALRYKHYVSGEFGPLKSSDNNGNSNIHATTTSSLAHKVFDDDEDGSSSDWDAPSRNGGDDDQMRVIPGGLRPYSGLLSAASLGLHSNNASSTSFGTAPEGFSINDGASIRETNSSILDWSESVSPSPQPQPQPSYAKRAKTIHANESIMRASSRSGRRAPSYHIRSQSMPLVNTHGRVPLPSENWDEDFLDDGDEGGCLNMVIPRAIEEQQASVIGHLGCVREFALLVEDLKHLRSLAISAGVRNGVHQAIFDEAEGIIALATLDDDEPLPAVDVPVRTPPSKTSHRRSSILLPDDDVFGGGSGVPSTPLLRRSFGHTPPNISPQSRKTIDKNDPVEVAKGIMERMQHSGGHHVRGQSDDVLITGKPKKVQFDTDMLRELVKHVGKLKRTIQSIVDDARDIVESPLDMEDGFECRGSFEGFEDNWDFGRAAGTMVGVV